MAQSFGAETPVLWYGPRAQPGHDPGGRNDRFWLLWPAWAHRVIAPRLRRRRINVLQRAVLGVLRSSRQTAEEIGRRLGIEPALAAYVVLELQEQRRVDDGWAVTKAGYEVLGGEEAEAADLVPGWVFRDPWNEALWPFIAPTLERARTIAGGERPVLDLGTTGEPWHQAAWMQQPPAGEEPAPPDAREILRAASRQSRLVGRTRRLEAEQEDAESIAELSRVDLDRVSSIELAAEPVFLATFLYVPREEGETAPDWHACDFFGLGSSPALRKLVVETALGHRPLGEALDRKLLGRTRHGSLAEERRAVSERALVARRLLEAALTVDVTRHAVAEPLSQAFEAWLEARALSGEQRFRNVGTACRRTMERLFGEIAGRYPLSGIAQRLTRHELDINRARLEEAAAAGGLSRVPDSMASVSQDAIRHVAERGTFWQLRPLLMATVLKAEEEPSHPLRIAAARAPDLLAQLDRIVRLGGQAAHDSPDDEFDQNAADVCLDATVEVVGRLLALPFRALEEVAEAP